MTSPSLRKHGLFHRLWAKAVRRLQRSGTVPSPAEDRDANDDYRDDPVYGTGSPSESGGDQGVAPEKPTHLGLPRDRGSTEPLGPVTPDPGRPLGDTAEAHDEISPHDLPKGHPGRRETERLAHETPDHTTRGNR